MQKDISNYNVYNKSARKRKKFVFTTPAPTGCFSVAEPLGTESSGIISIISYAAWNSKIKMGTKIQ